MGTINLDEYIRVSEMGVYDLKIPPPPGSFLDTRNQTKIPQWLRVQKIKGRWNILGSERTDLTFMPLLDTGDRNRFFKDFNVSKVSTIQGDSFDSDVLMTAWGVYNEVTGFLRTYRVHDKDGLITEWLFYLGDLPTRSMVDCYAHFFIKGYSSREIVQQEAAIDISLISYSVQLRDILINANRIDRDASDSDSELES